MTVTLDNTRRTDRAAKAKPHVGSYYGWRLREVLADPDEPSIVERWSTFGWRVALIFGLVIAGATLALWIVL